MAKPPPREICCYLKEPGRGTLPEFGNRLEDAQISVLKLAEVAGLHPKTVARAAQVRVIPKESALKIITAFNTI